MDNRDGVVKAVDKKLYGTTLQSGSVGDKQSFSRKVLSKGWHSINCAANAVKETGTSLWNWKMDYSVTKYEAGRVTGSQK